MPNRSRHPVRLPGNCKREFKPEIWSCCYLGCDPFNDPTFSRPKRNEPSCVAFLSPDAPVTLDQKIKQSRLKLRKTRKQTALELGVSVKTPWGWETGRWKPTTTFTKIGEG